MNLDEQADVSKILFAECTDELVHRAARVLEKCHERDGQRASLRIVRKRRHLFR